MISSAAASTVLRLSPTSVRHGACRPRYRINDAAEIKREKLNPKIEKTSGKQDFRAGWQAQRGTAMRVGHYEGVQCVERTAKGPGKAHNAQRVQLPQELTQAAAPNGRRNTPRAASSSRKNQTPQRRKLRRDESELGRAIRPV
jgi:hypothetical protein